MENINRPSPTNVFSFLWNDNFLRNMGPKYLHKRRNANTKPNKFHSHGDDGDANGANYHYCFSKAQDLRLQNVEGYFFIADDTLFNFWNDVPVDKVNQPVQIDYHSTMYWSKEYGEKFTELVEGKFKQDNAVQKAWKQYEAGLLKMGVNRTAKEHMTDFTGKASHDYLYIPTSYMEYFSNMIEVFVETSMFIENVLPKLMHSIEYNKGEGFYSLWGSDRDRALQEFVKLSTMGVHPVKLSHVRNNLDQRKTFCDNVISRFISEIFWS